MERNIINFSFIIPHKNIPELLQRCIDSIPAREDTEIIIVDDNSSTDKVDFNNFPGLERKNVQIVFNKEGGGAGKARNIGLDKAKGKWIFFADCDDIYTDKLNAFLDSHVNSTADIIYFKCEVINTIYKKRKDSRMNFFIDRYLSGKGNIEDIKFGAWEPWNKMIRRSVAIENNVRFDEISSSNDKMFSLRLGCCVKDVEVSNQILYNYILRKGSIIHSAKEKKFLNSFNTMIDQNSLYHKIGYKRKIFLPFFFASNIKYMNKTLFDRYFTYLKENNTHPLEGFIHNFLFFLIQKKN